MGTVGGASFVQEEADSHDGEQEEEKALTSRHGVHGVANPIVSPGAIPGET
jgi:hypothetical protein